MAAFAPRPETGVILIRLSDFRDEDEITFTMREQELRKAAESVGITDIIVLVENDLESDRKMRGKSAHKENLRVEFNGLVGYRTDRPVYTRALRMLQSRQRTVLIVGDESRISRNWTDGKALADAVRTGKASVLAIDDAGKPRWILRDGGSREEIKTFYEEIDAARRFSVDIGIKVAKGRRRWAGKSYQGGPRPFGYRVMAGTEPHRRNLEIDQAEAAVLREAAADILQRGISLKAIAARLREGKVPPVRAGTWSVQGIRRALLKPGVAGLAVRGGDLVPAPWDAIIPRDTWEELRAFLNDPDRRTNVTTANEPRWLVSGFATCEHGEPVGVHGGKSRRPSYMVGSSRNSAAKQCCYVRRQAEAVDEWVAQHVIAQLDLARDRDLLKPPPGPGVDRAALRAERDRLEKQKDSKLAMNVRGALTDADLEKTLKDIYALIADIDAQLASDPAAPDPLAEFRDEPAGTVWKRLTMARKRVITQRVIESVVIHPVSGKGGGSGFDKTTVTVTPRTL